MFYEDIFEHYTMLTIAVLNMISCSKRKDRYENYKEAMNRIEQIKEIREMNDYETDNN